MTLGDIFGGGGGGGGFPSLPGLPQFPGLPGFPMMGGGQSQGGGTFGDTTMSAPYGDSSNPYGDSSSLGGTMNLQSFLDMLQRNQSGGGGQQSVIGGQGLI